MQNRQLIASCVLSLLTAVIGLLRGGRDAAATELSVVQVKGMRGSMELSEQIKQDNTAVVDVIVAQDIGKLPDFSVMDALQRISGVQIGRDRGEGSGVAIRGLNQVETTLNGREVFTAGTGRVLDLADLPAELVSRLEVWKTPDAARLEGGVGGAIDVRMYRPFDFAGSRLIVSARQVHDALAQAGAPQYTLLASQRWRVGDGELGLLFSGADQRRAWREDQKSNGVPTARDDLVPGQQAIVPNGSTESSSTGHRARRAANVVLEWRPTSALALYADGSDAQFKTIQDTYQINLSAGPVIVPGSVQLFPHSPDVERITWRNAPVSVLSFARDTGDRTRQGALGGRWHGGSWEVRVDLSRTRAEETLFFSGPVLSAVAPLFTQDFSTSLPASSVSGVQLLDPAVWRLAGLTYRLRPYSGGLTAARFDVEHPLAGPGWRSLAFGLREARRSAGNGNGLVNGDTALGNMLVGRWPGGLQPNPDSDFFPGAAVPSVGNYLVGSLGQARDAIALRQTLGIVAAPQQGNSLSQWQIAERTRSAYLMATFDDGAAIEGNAGLRVIRTGVAVAGYQSQPTSGGVVSLLQAREQWDALPSLNLRYAPDAAWVGRLAASRSMTRPSFDQLSPSLTLVSNSINPSANLGSAGNPALEPVRAWNLDLGLERYAGHAAAATLGLFFKRVDGFVTSVSAPEVHDGALFQVSRPQNGQGATIRGAEAGYQRFFDRFSGLWRGLGVQANYTLVDSATPSSLLGSSTTLQNLSRNSANMVVLYERGPLSGRLAYNWRSAFLNGIASVAGVGALPVYTAGYGWLDASCTYRVAPGWTVALEGNNLLGTVRRAYYAMPGRQQSSWLNDRQYSLTATWRY